MNADSSRGSFGARPYASVNISRRDLGADPGPLRRREDACHARAPSAALTSADPPGDGDLEGRRVLGPRERLAQLGRGGLPWPRRRPSVRSAVIWSALGCRPSANSDAIWSAVTSWPTAMSTSASADPAHRPGDLAALAVVVRQPGVLLVGRIQGSDLPGQVRIPVPGGQLVDRHHDPLSTDPPSYWTWFSELFSSNFCSNTGPAGGG